MTGSNQPLSINAPGNSLDKIFYSPAPASMTVAQSANPTAPTVSTVTITNPQNTTFFIDMQVSVDNTTWYDSGFEPYYISSGVVAFVKRFAGWWTMTSSTITLSFYALDAGYTIYYRLVGYSKA